MANYRMSRLSEDVKRELSAIIRELKDPRIPELVTVTGVNITPDMKFAKVFVSVYGDGDTVKNALTALQCASGHIRRTLSARIDMRITPELTFKSDDSIAYGAHISRVLHDLNITADDDTDEGQENE